MRYDVVVVGAGPAGSSAAYHLAHRGVRVLLVDRDVFPREKACGDGIGPRCVDLLDGMGVRRCLVGQRPVRGIRIADPTAGGSSVALFPAHGTRAAHGFVVPRLALDHELVERAEDAGALFWPSTAVGAFRIENGRICGVRATHAGNGVSIDADVTLIADGSKGRLGQLVRGRDTTSTSIGYALRQYATGVTVEDDLFELYAPISLGGSTVAGYAWIFPGLEHVNIGIGFSIGRADPGRVNLRQLWDAARAQMQERFPHLADLRPVTPPIGAPLRLTLEPERCFADGALLLGDAAGAIDPFTGEGILYALETGALAAPVVEAALGDSERLRDYPIRLRERYARQVHLGPVLPDVFGLAERTTRAMGGGLARSVIDRGTRRGPVGGAIQAMVFDLDRQSGELSHAEAVARTAPEAAAFYERVAEAMLGSVREIHPLVSESLRYVLASPTAPLRLSASVAWALARCWDITDTESVFELAEAGELLALARLILAGVGSGHGSRFETYYDGIALLWADISLARSVASLFELRTPVIRAILAGGARFFEAALHRERRHDPAARLDAALVTLLDCTPICTAGALGVAHLAGVNAERAAWARRWARYHALAERSISCLVAALVGDEVLGIRRGLPDRARAFARQARQHVHMIERTIGDADAKDPIEPFTALLGATRHRLEAASQLLVDSQSHTLAPVALGR